jgi:hypothetical protein
MMPEDDLQNIRRRIKRLKIRILLHYEQHRKLDDRHQFLLDILERMKIHEVLAREATINRAKIVSTLHIQEVKYDFYLN